MSPSVFSAGNFSLTTMGMPNNCIRGASWALLRKMLGLPAAVAAIVSSLTSTVGWMAQTLLRAFQPGSMRPSMPPTSANVTALAPERVTDTSAVALRMPSGLPAPSPRRKA